jgi:Zn ribbon nucleic-acid-binding protein
LEYKTMNATTITIANKNHARRGFPGIRCPLCGTADDVQSLDLDELTTFRCAGCEEQYTADDIRELLAAWQQVLNWIDAAPTVSE